MWFSGRTYCRIMAVFGAVLFLLGGSHSASASVNVVTSVNGLYRIATAIMSSVGTPSVIVSSDQAVASYQMTTSDLNRVSNADVVLWFGGSVDGFMSTAVSQASTSTEVLTASHIASSNGWLDANGVIQVAEELTTTLVQLDPDNASIYQENLDRLRSDPSMVNVIVAADPTRVFATPDAQGDLGSPTSVRVVASIEPLKAIASAIMKPLGTPSVIVSGSETPHGYQLTTSEASQLSAADVVLWVGPELEGFLDDPISHLPASAHVLTAMSMPGMVLYPVRHDDIWPHRRHNQHGTSSSYPGSSSYFGSTPNPIYGSNHGTHGNYNNGLHLGHRPSGNDPHLWMDTRNAVVIAQNLTEVLCQLDPNNAPVFRKNLESFKIQAAKSDTIVANRLNEVKDKPFVVYHDAYQYLEQRYGLNGVGAMVRHPEDPMSTRQLNMLGTALAGTSAVCFFLEPQFSVNVPEGILGEGISLKMGRINPLGGGNYNTSENQYLVWITGVADAMFQCLGQ